MPQAVIERHQSAIFSDDQVYRYQWRHDWDRARPTLNIVMLNPSTADEVVMDPTVTRCVGHARRLGYGQLIVTNLFALRSTNPKELYRADDPVGPLNDQWLWRSADEVREVWVAWGVHGKLQGRDTAVLQLLDQVKPSVWALSLTQGGHPRHPLYLKNELIPFVYEREHCP